MVRIRGYKRRTKNGRTTRVKSHDRRISKSRDDPQYSVSGLSKKERKRAMRTVDNDYRAFRKYVLKNNPQLKYKFDWIKSDLKAKRFYSASKNLEEVNEEFGQRYKDYKGYRGNMMTTLHIMKDLQLDEAGLPYEVKNDGISQET